MQNWDESSGVVTRLSRASEWFIIKYEYGEEVIEYKSETYYSSSIDIGDIIIIYINPNNPKEVFDIGGNTGKFEKACLNYSSDVKLTMLDLPENLDRAKANINNDRCNFYGINVIAENPQFPKMSGAVLMSQFLDCFSEKQIISIF